MLKGLTPLQAGAALPAPAQDRGNAPGTASPPGRQEKTDTQDDVEATGQVGEPDVQALLEPLPPGWTALNRRLHPDSDVFEDDLDMDMPNEEETRKDPDNGLNQASSMAPPSPVGPPPQQRAEQKARLQALLKQCDEHGRAPFGLDEFSTDAEMWAAYRRSQKASYPKGQRQFLDDADIKTGERRALRCVFLSSQVATP